MDLYNIAKKRLKIKNNIFLLIFLILVFGIIMFLLSLYRFYTNGLQNIYNNNIDVRRFIVSSDNLDVNFLENIENVEAVYNARYIGDVYLENLDLFDGEAIYVKPIITSNDIKTTDEKNIKNGEMVCPIKFYPYSRLSGRKVEYLKLQDGRKFIDKNLQYKDYNYKIIDTFDSDHYNIEKDTCLVLFDDFKKLVNDLEIQQSEDYVVQIDNIHNIDSSLKVLDDNNYFYSAVYNIDYETINTITHLSKNLLLIVIILTLIFLIFIVFKRNKSCMGFYDLLKTLGYQNKEVLFISGIEILFIILIAFVISLFGELGILWIFNYSLFSEIVFETSGLEMQYLSLLPMIIFLILYIEAFNYFNINKCLDR